jgi:hypothetical protein
MNFNGYEALTKRLNVTVYSKKLMLIMHAENVVGFHVTDLHYVYLMKFLTSQGSYTPAAFGKITLMFQFEIKTCIYQEACML